MINVSIMFYQDTVNCNDKCNASVEQTHLPQASYDLWLILKHIKWYKITLDDCLIMLFCLDCCKRIKKEIFFFPKFEPLINSSLNQ